jgi:hypothetical protein
MCRRIAVATACVSALTRLVSAGVGDGKGEARVIRFLNVNDSWQVPWHEKASPDMVKMECPSSRLDTGRRIDHRSVHR